MLLKVHPQKEDYWGFVNSIGIRSCYDEGKRMAESLTYDFARKYNLKLKLQEYLTLMVQD